MKQRRQRFTQAEIARALKGARDAGITDARVVIDPDGSMSIFTGSGAVPMENSFDRLMAK